jgi:hypothetical protein
MINQPPVLVVREQKSVAVAVLLSFFFGPFGMFYSTTTGAVVMLAVNLVIGCIGFLTLGIGWFLYIGTWIGGIIWAAIEANNYNTRLVAPVVPVVPVIPAVQMMPPSQPYVQSGPYQQPGSMPSQYPQSGPYQQPGSMPSQYPQSGPYQQPGSMPSQYPQSGPYQQPGQYPQQ